MLEPLVLFMPSPTAPLPASGWSVCSCPVAGTQQSVSLCWKAAAPGLEMGSWCFQALEVDQEWKNSAGCWKWLCPLPFVEFLRGLRVLAGSWLQQQSSTKATLRMAAGEALLPCLPCKCSSFSTKSPDISSWKNPSACVMENSWGTCLGWGWMTELWMKLPRDAFLQPLPNVNVCREMETFPSEVWQGRDAKDGAAVGYSMLQVRCLLFLFSCFVFNLCLTDTVGSSFQSRRGLAAKWQFQERTSFLLDGPDYLHHQEIPWGSLYGGKSSGFCRTFYKEFFSHSVFVSLFLNFPFAPFSFLLQRSSWSSARTKALWSLCGGSAVQQCFSVQYCCTRVYTYIF